MEDNFIKCADGKEREIFPARIKDKNLIRHYSVKFRQDMAIMNLLTPDVEKIKRAEADNVELPDVDMFTDEPYDALMEIIVLAFGNKYTKEEVEEFLDVSMIPTIIDTFYGMSNFKKKASQTIPELAGMNSVPQS